MINYQQKECVLWVFVYEKICTKYDILQKIKPFCVLIFHMVYPRTQNVVNTAHIPGEEGRQKSWLCPNYTQRCIYMHKSLNPIWEYISAWATFLRFGLPPE